VGLGVGSLLVHWVSPSRECGGPSLGVGHATDLEETSVLFTCVHDSTWDHAR
jgi:hypothetical protein